MPRERVEEPGPGDDPCANFRKGRFSFGNFGACRYVPVSRGLAGTPTKAQVDGNWQCVVTRKGATSTMTHYKGISAENANFVSKDTGNMTPFVKLTTQAGHNITPMLASSPMLGKFACGSTLTCCRGVLHVCKSRI